MFLLQIWKFRIHISNSSSFFFKELYYYFTRKQKNNIKRFVREKSYLWIFFLSLSLSVIKQKKKKTDKLSSLSNVICNGLSVSAKYLVIIRVFCYRFFLLCVCVCSIFKFSSQSEIQAILINYKLEYLHALRSICDEWFYTFWVFLFFKTEFRFRRSCATNLSMTVT